MLKKILEKSAFEALHEELQKLYKISDDGKYRLQLEDDDAEPLRRAKDHEVGLRQIAERDLAAARAELETTKAKVGELEAAQSSDTQALRADHDKVVAKLKDEHGKELLARDNTIKKIFVNDVAISIAKEIGIDEGAAELLTDSIKKRLVVEMVNGEPVTRVVAADGQASNASPDDLKEEYLQNAKYAGILRGSKASGGGASGGGKGGGASGKKLDDLSDAERNKIQKENPAEWQRLLQEKRDSINA